MSYIGWVHFKAKLNHLIAPNYSIRTSQINEHFFKCGAESRF